MHNGLDALTLSISMVVFKPDIALLMRTLESVCTAADTLRAHEGALPVLVWLVNNDHAPLPDYWRKVFKDTEIQCEVIHGHGNIGYGRAHNLAIERVQSQYHLILNPDVELAADALVQALRFFNAQPGIGLIAPHVSDGAGATQYLCRRSPTLFDLWLRGFAPAFIRACFEHRLARYELRDVINTPSAPSYAQSYPHALSHAHSETVMPCLSPPIVSGCFMLFRTDVLKKIGGFDPHYFLYFEDYDLSLRTHAVARIAYVPAVRIRHFGGGAARKGIRHIRWFIASAFRFFNRFGWKWL